MEKIKLEILENLSLSNLMFSSTHNDITQKKVARSACTAKRILERLAIQTSSSFVNNFKANSLFFWHVYGLFFYPETNGAH